MPAKHSSVPLLLDIIGVMQLCGPTMRAGPGHGAALVGVLVALAAERSAAQTCYQLLDMTTCVGSGCDWVAMSCSSPCYNYFSQAACVGDTSVDHCEWDDDSTSCMEPMEETDGGCSTDSDCTMPDTCDPISFSCYDLTGGGGGDVGADLNFV